MFVILEPFENRKGHAELAPSDRDQLRSYSPTCTKAVSASSARRRSTGWAARAASSCRCRTARRSARGAGGRAWNLAVPGQPADPRVRGPVQQLQRQPAAALRRRRPRQGQEPGRVARRPVSTPCRSTSARPTSTTSRFGPQLAGERAGRLRATACRSEDIGELEVRNADGEMVPLRTLSTSRDDAGPAIVNHYNMYPSAEINGNTAPGISSGQAIAIMEQSPAGPSAVGMGFEWTELTLPADPGRQGPADQAGLPAGGGVRASWCWRRSTRAGRCRWRSS